MLALSNRRLHRKATLRRERLVLQRVRIHDPAQRIPENVRVVAVVEAPFEFFEIAVNMLLRDVVERADDVPA